MGRTSISKRASDPTYGDFDEHLAKALCEWLAALSRAKGPTDLLRCGRLSVLLEGRLQTAVARGGEAGK